MSKDRYKEFQENIEKHGDGDDISTIKIFTPTDMEAPSFGEFFNEVDTLRNSIDKFTKLVEDVEHLQNAMLAGQINFGTEEKLQAKTMEVKLLGHQIRKELNRIKRIYQNQPSIKEKKSCQRIIECQIDAMTKSLCAIMNKYYELIMNYHEKRTKQVQRQCQIAGSTKPESEIVEIFEKQHLTMYPEIIIQTEQAKQESDQMELRHKELIKLETGIRDTHDMIFDITHLIESQGDQISYITEKTKYTEFGVDDACSIISARKITHCFHLKFYKKRFISSLARIFSSCI